MYKIRPVEHKDCLDIFNLSNDPAVRKISLSDKEINYSDHLKWFEKVLADRNILFYAITIDEKLAAQVRFKLHFSKLRLLPLITMQIILEIAFRRFQSGSGYQVSGKNIEQAGLGAAAGQGVRSRCFSMPEMRRPDVIDRGFPGPDIYQKD